MGTSMTNQSIATNHQKPPPRTPVDQDGINIHAGQKKKSRTDASVEHTRQTTKPSHVAAKVKNNARNPKN